MKKFALLLAVSTLGLSCAASAYDTDPGYGPDAPGRHGMWYGGHEGESPLMYGARGQQPLYYTPTMRYYGNGYTVSYRYVPVYIQNWTATMSAATNFRTEPFHLSNEEIAAFGANQPRLTVKDPHSAVSRAPVTTIIRKTPSGKKGGKGAATDAVPADAPVITPSPAPAPATTQSPSPAPAAVPAPAPAAQPKP